MVHVVATVGYEETTVERVLVESGVSRRTFYELYADREDCSLAAYEAAIGRVLAVVTDAYLDCGRAGGRGVTPARSRPPRKLPPRRPDQFPRGRHGLSADEVAASQRTRILDAMKARFGERGFHEASMRSNVP